MLMLFAAGSWNWNSSSVNTALIFASSTRPTSRRDGPLRFANYVFHRTDPHTPGGGKAFLVHKDIDHYAVPVSGLHHIEPTAIHLLLATRPVKLVSAYLSPIRPLIESGLTECLSGGIPVLIAVDLNAKHSDWNSRLITARGSLLRDYADRNSCLIYGPDSPTMAPYMHNATPDVLDTVVAKDFVLPVYLAVCAALSSDHLPIMIDTTCRSSFHNLPDPPTSREWTGLHSRPALKTDSREIPWWSTRRQSTSASRS
jgi:hypothetical protein